MYEFEFLHVHVKVWIYLVGEGIDIGTGTGGSLALVGIYWNVLMISQLVIEDRCLNRSR